MLSKNKKIIIFAPAILIAAIGIFYGLQKSNEPGKYDNFAKCLKDKGAIFYGAFWCPHCQNQKSMFGKSEKYLPYVECSTADGKAQLSVCRDKDVKSYPTWDFPDGSRLTGEIAFEVLSQKTTCRLP